MNKIKLSILGVLFFTVTSSIFYSCSNEEKGISEDSELKSYSNIKIGEFTSGEIGIIHNKVLQSLSDKGKLKGSQKEIIFILSKANIDKRISNLDIEKSTNQLYQSKIFISSTNIQSKQSSISKLQEETLEYLISELEISSKAKEKIDYLSNLGLVDINSMKEETNSLLNSIEYTDKEKQYFAVYTSIYENSKLFWGSKYQNKSSKLQKVQRVAPYAADATGAILGLYGGPVWSIIQGALLSAAFD
ncbi:hypothetical protein ACE1MK_15305 [Tenacibaculum maritimum]|uniref:hypothetical protein n=1 Tax=Tenacibaculum maritimum TaxID=107401 RepID=UPI0012E649E8|nr:hypothetical protein [Tenacibaculum maritimum]MCD9581765.1 hypothetical protein [Tenacibaculum maritimum]MCD9635939.1 hypothetical protein [Tenacibaculum maritimum]CAA0149674.1 hypothetical protein USCSE301_10057 [Tenacibaculum maritimum]CAA0223404.1 hypothetical protein USCSP91_40108 [Tenacibaculum maritimum]